MVRHDTLLQNNTRSARVILPRVTTADPPTFTRIFGWAAFLACSWTWCIGMFLPVFLLRDFGPASFWVFAVPNVVGAALMGVLLARPGASEALVARHGWACWAFSLVTAAFQWFFFFWMVLGLPDNAGRWVIIPAAGVILLCGQAVRGRRTFWTRAFALAVFAASAFLAAAWYASDPPSSVVAQHLPEAELVWLAPVVLFGFALCPYLDLTFHQARQHLPGRAGNAAFVIGFGVLFFAMILLTRDYAPPLLGIATARAEHVHPGLLAIVALPLLAHVAVQLIYTVMVHKSWLDARPSPAGPRAPANAAFLALLIGLGLALLAWHVPPYRGASGPLSAPELVYRGFMAFYGLAFPAYVWLCVLNRGPLTRRTLQVYAFAVLAASPMYWMGFIERQTWWLAPGLGVVLLARLFIPNAAASTSVNR